MSIIGLGTAAIGRPQYINIRADNSKPHASLERFRLHGLDLLEQAYQLGVRYFDTAPGYGMAEQLLSDWLKTHPDKQPEIATKWGYRYTANFNPRARVHEVKEHSLDMLNQQWAQSKHLLTGISTLQIHSATFDSGVLKNEAVLNRLQKIKTQEQIKIGLSSTGANQTEVIEAALNIHRDGEPLFEVFQVTYNMLDQSLATLMPALKGKRVVIKEALANGRIFPNLRYPGYKALYDSLDRMALEHEVGIDAIALRYVMDRIEAFAVLSGASNLQQLSSNLKAQDFSLSADELAELGSHAIEPQHYWNERKQLRWN